MERHSRSRHRVVRRNRSARSRSREPESKRRRETRLDNLERMVEKLCGLSEARQLNRQSEVSKRSVIRDSRSSSSPPRGSQARGHTSHLPRSWSSSASAVRHARLTTNTGASLALPSFCDAGACCAGTCCAGACDALHI